MRSIRDRWETGLAKLDEREAARTRKLPAWRTRRRRQLLGGVLLLGNAILIATALLVRLEHPWLLAGLWASGFVVGSLGWAMLRIVSGKMSSGFSSMLDEREREWRHRVNHTGFQVLAALMLLALVYLLAIANTADAAWRGALMLSALLCLGSCVPTLLLGWSLPDDDPEDFVDEENGNG